MNRVKLMLSGIPIMAAVAAALAMETKTPNVCLYQATIAVNPPSVAMCPLVQDDCDNVSTVVAASTLFARTLECPWFFDCESVTLCNQSRALMVEE